MERFEVERFRRDFAYLDEGGVGRKILYLDNAATTQRPKPVIEALKNYYSYENANPHRGAHYLGIRATQLYEAARDRVGRFLNSASCEEIIFVRNATEGLNLIATSYALRHLKAGDEILISVMEHHSNLVTWQFVAQKTGAVLNYVYLDEGLNLDMEDFRRKLGPKTKLLSITGASNVIATRPDLAELVREAKKVGAVTVIDAAQLIPHQRLDVQELGCDFAVFSGHKIYAPMGIGVLYAKREVLEKMSPYQYGGDMIEYVYEQEATFAPVPARFEAGTQNVGGAVALHRAIDYVEEVGLEEICRHEKELANYACRRLKELGFVDIYRSASEDCSPLVSFNVRDVHSHDVSSILDTYGIAIRTGHHCTMPLHKYLGLNATCRASFALYNTLEEVDLFVEKLKEVRRVMGYGT